MFPFLKKLFKNYFALSILQMLFLWPFLIRWENSFVNLFADWKSALQI